MQHRSQGLAKGPTAGTTGLLHDGVAFSADDIERHIARGKQMQAEAIAAMLTAAFRRLGGLVQRRPAGHGSTGHRPTGGHAPAVPHRA
ncbi:MAG: RSP_7527 family protein [Bacteroidota bacterium]